MEKPMVFWNTRKLSKEFGVRPLIIAKLLKKMGAKRWSKSNRDGGSIWFWEDDA